MNEPECPECPYCTPAGYIPHHPHCPNSKESKQACAVKFVPRTVIENKLLARLEDGSGTVAILVNEEDLKLLIFALSQCKSPLAMPMARDLDQLRRGAFP